MVIFPPCKINIGLQVVARRTDGYHNLKTLFYPLPMYDVLEVIHSDKTTLKLSGRTIQGKIEDNLCIKAYYLLKKDFPKLPEVNIYLHKTIPAGAGLGGGSADAAYSVRLLNKKFNLQLSYEQMLQYASQLGSDCSFFIQDKPCFATGRGDELQPVDMKMLSSCYFVIVCPKLHIETAWAYSQIKPQDRTADFLKLFQNPLSEWKYTITNDFEKPAFEKHPSLLKIKETLYKQGALYASLSGSGSTLYGIFQETITSSQFHFTNAKVWILKKPHTFV